MEVQRTWAAMLAEKALAEIATREAGRACLVQSD